MNARVAPFWKLPVVTATAPGAAMDSTAGAPPPSTEPTVMVPPEVRVRVEGSLKVIGLAEVLIVPVL